MAFAKLKKAMSAILATAPHTVSAPPQGANAAVDDFNATDDQGIVSFTWTYNNPGDYNQDGLTSISDLSVLGRYLGHNANSPDWAAARVADGNGDGLISISDLSPLGANLQSAVEGYLLRSSATPQDPDTWTVIADVPLADATVSTDTSRLTFRKTINLADLPQGLVYYQVVPYQGTSIGIGSNSDTLTAAPPAIAGVSPLAGKSGQTVAFTAQVFGDPPLTYAWDFGGGATPNTSSSVTPSVKLGAAGSYTGVLTVTNALASDTFQFALTIKANAKPTVSVAAQPNAGAAPLVVTLTATAADSDGTIDKYEWDLNGDGTFEEDTGTTAETTGTFTKAGVQTISVRVTDTDGGTATANTRITVAAKPSAVIKANQTQIVAPGYSSLDATGSSSPNGAITDYKWDWDGDGIIDADTKADPHIRALIDAKPGVYDATVIVTDATGATGTASTPVTVTAVQFVNPPVESYQDFSGRGDSATQRWLKNSYSTLPEWRDSNGPYQSAFFAAWTDTLFTLLNGQRVANGLAPCKRLPILDLVMQAHERDQALRSYFSHVNPEGMNWKDRIFAVNPPATLENWGEIIGQGAETPEEEMQLWMASPGHRAVVLEPGLNYCGIGVYWKTNGAKGLESYWGIEFAAFKGLGTPPPDYHWLEPQEVVR